MLRSFALKGLRLADELCVAVGPRALPEAGSLISVLFHSLYASKTQAAGKELAPNENVTVDDFRSFVSAILESGYQAVSPAQVAKGLAPGGNYVMITFDDGYFNNTLALDVLEEFQTPATFFVSTNHVLQGKAFWWDAFARRLCEAGLSPRALNMEIKGMKSLTNDRIEAILCERYGSLVLAPFSDIDRPFKPDELRDFARNPWVHLGNHTCDHAILTNCDAAEIARQIRGCQQALTQIAGVTPVAIAYPNGNFSQAAVDASIDAGLRVGLTVKPHRNRLPPADDRSLMTLGRFVYFGGQDAKRQCRHFGSRFLPSNAVRKLMHSGW